MFVKKIVSRFSQCDGILTTPIRDHLVKELNADPEVHGILVQVPLPEHMNEREVLDVISTEKDVDGFHPLNVGTIPKSSIPNYLFKVNSAPYILIEAIKKTLCSGRNFKTLLTPSATS